MANDIHPTAVIDPGAELRDGIVIGPYCVIGAGVKLGDGCRLHNHVTLAGPSEIGPSNEFYPYASIGQRSQDLKYAGDPTEVVIGDDNSIRECVTINRATSGQEQTRLGNSNLLMAYSHIGHNCQLGDRIVIANGVAVAGHVVIGDRAVIGGVLGIHQFVHIGSMAMLGGMSRIDRDVPPFTMVEGHPGRLRGLNRLGIRRSGLADLDDGAQLRQLQQLWTLLYRSDRVMASALAAARELDLLEAGEQLVAFLEASTGPGRRGPLPAQR